MNTSEFIFKPIENTIQATTVTWQTPSNIALVKYWGKTNPQLPKNASISFTLNNCHTITSISFEKKETTCIDFELFFEGEKKEDFKPKINTFFERILAYCPYIKEYKMVIDSKKLFST